MVGVPGRSKACKTCRSRRVKCDLQRPSCGQCQRRQVTCGGYERQLIFVNNTSQEVPSSTFRLGNKAYSTADRGSERTLTRAPPSPQTIHQHAFVSRASEERMVGWFWSTYLPNGRSASSESAQFSLYGWTTLIRDMYDKNNMVRAAVLASVLGRMAGVEDSPTIRRKSHELYGWTLLSLARILQEPSKHPCYLILSALKLLGFYELWSRSDESSHPNPFKAWSSHVTGNAAFILLRDPSAFIEGHAHRLFADSRYGQAIVGIKLRKPSPLAQPEWKTIPWKIIQKTPRDSLLDIMIELPGIYEEVDSISACKDRNSQQDRRRQLRARCWSLSNDLQSWEAVSGRATLKFAESVLEAGNQVHSHPLSPDDLSKGILVLIYWAVCIMLYDVLKSDADLDPSFSQVSNIRPRFAEPSIYCRKVAALLPCFLTPDTSTNYLILYPVGTALQYQRKIDKGTMSKEQVALMQAFTGNEGKTAMAFMNDAHGFKGSTSNSSSDQKPLT
ncbi:unnamed protein product [Clonostachys rhizophaga]|uniref:Zn(2)-C6 fungal-type domain-containing protein n=1 Tax=Clonostachys rhizophaga TaxID=160324 RepID=A0A9N9VWB2_9HYPO|nr:unnamed protein product [Clonostachys rhizophaga]